MNVKKSLLTIPDDPPYSIAKPEAESHQGVLVLPAWWRLNTFFMQFCNRLAKEGFAALALDYYNGEIASTIEEADFTLTLARGTGSSRKIDRKLMMQLRQSWPGSVWSNS
jgi:carboxymethylenebutenolidase